MIKEIKYNGYSSLLSDYECPDGDLSASINLINEVNGLTAIRRPAVISEIPPYLTLLTTHRLPSGVINMIAINKERTLSFITLSDNEDISDVRQWKAISHTIPPFDGTPSIVPVGNTLAALFQGQPLRYFLFKDGSYRDLGSRPPFTSIEFALDYYGPLGSGAASYKVKLPVRFSNPRTPNHLDSPEENQRTRQLQDEFDNILFSFLNSHVSRYVTSLGRFHQPFFVRYAYRLFDGSHAWHSVPVLMLPTVIAPPIRLVGYNPSHTDTYQTVSLSGDLIKTFSLYKRIIDTDTDKLKLWKDIITHIDIFITPPLYTYLFQSDYSGASADKGDNTSAQAQNTSRRTRLASLYEEALDFAAPPTSSDGFYPVYDSVGNNQTTGNRDQRQPSRADGDSICYFDGHYIFGKVNRSPVPGKNAIDNLAIDRIKTINPSDESDNPYVIAPPYNPQFVESIKNAANGDFRLFASIAVDEIEISEKVSYLLQESKNLSNLQSRKNLGDDYRSHADLHPHTAYVYNSRLNIANIDIHPAHMPPLRSALPMSTPVHSGSDTPVLKRVSSVDVFLRKNGAVIKSGINCSALDRYGFYGATDEKLAEYPRYIFYPDPDAFCISIILSDLKTLNIPLVRHDFLDGAYFFGGIAEFVELHECERPENAASLSSFYSNSDSIRLSEVNNPFFFPPSYAVSVGSAPGNTAIIALASAARPLSQGQFGQFPLYAFTSEGVWAVEINSTGVYSARQPITRDVCINAAAITSIDSSVLFPTRRGIMLIAGSSTQCFSENIDTETPFNLSRLPAINRLQSMVEHINDDCLKIAPFSDFLDSCGIIYDYIRQRLIIYSPLFHYAYIYSLKSKQWGMAYSETIYGINSYPEALAVSIEKQPDGTYKNYLIDYSSRTGNSTKGLLVSRPFKLDYPDTLKTADTIIQRGHFNKDHIKSVIYGSRDLFSWNLIHSSMNHYLRGIHGTPYKYFRIALICELDDDESLTSVSFRFTPRMLNQPR